MSRQAAFIILMLIILISAIPRILGIFNDFWLDEIWSYSIAKQIGHPLDILLSSAAQIDNNHPLNTFFIWLMGEQPHWQIYRIPSLLAGIGSVILAAMITWRRGIGQAILATALVGFSYPLIHYSSEARGYAMAVFFALLAFDAVERYLLKPDWISAIIFWIACALGLLSHLTFFHIYAGLFVWSTYRIACAHPRRVAGRQFLRLHALPLICLSAFFTMFVHNLAVAGAESQGAIAALVSAISGLIYWRTPPLVELLLAGGLLCILIAMIRELYRRGTDSIWIFALFGLLLSPAFALAKQLSDPNLGHVIFPRYFLVLLPFVLIFLPIVWPRGRMTRNLVAVLLAVFFVANIWQTIQYLRIGRGQYAQAIRYISDNNPDPTITIFCHHPFRVGTVADFYRRVLPGDKTLEIVNQPSRAIWLISSEPDFRLSGFELKDEFIYYGLSGMNWKVYRRIN